MSLKKGVFDTSFQDIQLRRSVNEGREDGAAY
jgi:hypothetical protein